MLVCTENAEDMVDFQDVIEHIRRYHVSFIGRPGRPAQTDAHGHIWYCFGCNPSRSLNDHRSYDSDESIWDHLKRNHGTIIGCINPSSAARGTEARTLSHFRIEPVDF